MPLDGRRQEAGQVGDGELVLGGAQDVDGGHPARAEHDRDVVALDAGDAGQLGGGGPGGARGIGGGLLGHGCRPYRSASRQDAQRSACGTERSWSGFSATPHTAQKP